MTTDYEFLVPTFCICMYKNIRVWRLWAPPVAVGPCALHTLHTLLLRQWYQLPAPACQAVSLCSIVQYYSACCLILLVHC